MSRPKLAIIGHGHVGRACVAAVGESPDFSLAGVVVRPGARVPSSAPAIPIVEHVRDLGPVQAALVCVPPSVATGVARDLLQERIPIVECTILEGRARERHYEAVAAAALHHRVQAVLGAGWDPGMLSLFDRARDPDPERTYRLNASTRTKDAPHRSA